MEDFVTNDSPPPRRRNYEPAVGPRLRYLMLVVFVLTALLGVNSAYLAAITWMEWWSEQWGTAEVYQDYFYLWMVLLHLVLGLLVVVPFLVFAGLHLRSASARPNRRAVRIGYALFGASVALLGSGLLLMRIGVVELRHPVVRGLVYGLHVAMPLVVIWLYWLHRLAGPPIRWRAGLAYGALVLGVAGGMALLQSQDPRRWNVTGPASGEAYFRPSLARTASGKFIPADALMRDQYCLKCHADAYQGWFHSAHHFSSFNNPMYLASVRETRAVSLKRDGSVQAARWCAGCHDPVPFFSGSFDDPQFDDVSHPTAQAGITCTACHAITHVNSPRGNADYTIEEPLHYPFADSDHPWLQAINAQLVKAKPAFHKKTFLKPLHRTEEFCSACHKVHLPYELNHYREFLRGQNHYDPFLLSGASGHGARSNYYGMRANANCATCHMPLKESSDFGARLFPGAEQLSIHNHLFLGANTALPALRDEPEIVAAHQEFLKTAARVDLFGLKEGGTIEGTLTAPLRPALPELRPGQTYLLETVIRNLKVGHHLTQGTVDSNELWVEVTVTSGERLLAHNGQIDARGEVDRSAHFINVYMLDRNGRRIDRRNPQDIFTPLYNHQIPPGSAQVAHYRLILPEHLDDLVTVEVKLQYRKFDHAYWEFVTASAKPGDLPIRGQVPGQTSRNPLPVTTLASDRVVFPVAGVSRKAPAQAYPIVRDHIYMRWNDYGLALLGEGNGLEQSGMRSAELKQAEQIFRYLNDHFGYPDVRLHLARVLLAEGRLDEAAQAVRFATLVDKPLFFTEPVYAPWAINWVSGVVNRQQGNLEGAARNLRGVLTQQTQSMRDRGYDFGRDYVVHNELGQVLFEQARQAADPERREQLLREASEEFVTTLKLDPENVTAHYNLGLLFSRLGDASRAGEHSQLHARYKTDDTAPAVPHQIARRGNAAANRSSEGIVIYPLHATPRPLPAPAGEQAPTPLDSNAP
ncbi:MAG: response regulator aspartate phosphatase rapC [Planctomycetaceae bacterium]|nr:response regulator aspartate phosphatase rapC [Planctomycetaceae bacterium]